MSDLSIRSSRGIYSVTFKDTITLPSDFTDNRHCHYLVDSKVVGHFEPMFASLVNKKRLIALEATEENKSLARLSPVIEQLLSHDIKRDHILVAIGGGIIQDITSFLASILFRGMNWEFIPTTLLAQADSCIGSKTSINVGSVKNLVGNFWPPKKIDICTSFLKTLELKEIKSGVGEMLKVHAIEGPSHFQKIASDYKEIFTNDATMKQYILDSLKIKARFIEADELDTGVRNLLNYGHSFGHAIESASAFEIPHGVAVSMGMDLANFYSYKSGRMTSEHYSRMHEVLRTNYSDYHAVNIHQEHFFSAISKDKKNINGNLTLILPNQDGRIEKVAVAQNIDFTLICRNFFKQIKSERFEKRSGIPF